MFNKRQTAVEGQYPNGGNQENECGDALFSTCIIRQNEPVVNSEIDTSDLDAAIAYHLERFWHHNDRHEYYAADEHADEYRELRIIRARLVALAGGAQ